MFQTVFQTEEPSFQLFTFPFVYSVVIIILVMKGRLNTLDCFLAATKQRLSCLNHGFSRGILLRKLQQYHFTRLNSQTHQNITQYWKINERIATWTHLWAMEAFMYPLRNRWGTYLRCCFPVGRSSLLWLRGEFGHAAHTLNDPQAGYIGVLLCKSIE